MDRFSVNQLAKLAGVSVRTLHHYDEIGLLKPGTRTESKYRYYGEAELLRLQQILFYKELDLPLAKIVEILDDPSFDTEAALRSHKKELVKRKNRTNELLKTIDKTIHHLKEQKMKPEDLYKGFSKEQAQAYEREATDKWGSEIMEESKERYKKMSKADFEKLLQEGEDINKEMAKLMHLETSDSKVQALVERHFKMINAHYTATHEIYKGLAELYVTDERFVKHFDKHKNGLAEFLSKAMLKYSEKL